MTREEVIIPEMNLKNIIAESREVVQALNEFADELERIEKKYADPQESEEEEKEVIDAIVARPKCMYCEFATLKATDPPCRDCYFTANRPNFKPNESCKQLYSKIKEGMKNE